MSNACYVKGAEKILAQIIGGATLPAGDLTVAVLKNSYVPNLSSHEYVSSIAAHIVGDPVALTGKTVTGGKIDADDPTFEALPSGNTLAYLAIFIDTGSDATSPLLMLLDEVSNFPFVTDGGDYTPRWDNGANKIMSLV